jgi:hypothetical protein
MVALCMIIMQLNTWYLVIPGFYKWHVYAILIKNIASKHLTKTNNGQKYTYQFSSHVAMKFYYQK